MSGPTIMMDVQGGSYQHGQNAGQAQDRQVEVLWQGKAQKSERCYRVGGFAPWFLIPISQPIFLLHFEPGAGR